MEVTIENIAKNSYFSSPNFKDFDESEIFLYSFFFLSLDVTFLKNEAMTRHNHYF